MSPKFPAVTSDEIIAVLKKKGFVLKRHSGSSHAIFYRESNGRRTTVPVHTGKILKRKTFKSILVSANLTIDEFIDLNN